MPRAARLALLAAVAGHARGIKSLQQVLTAARQATPAGYVHRRGGRIISAAAFKGMRAYVLRRYTGAHVVSSFLDQRGQVVDCVPLRGAEPRDRPLVFLSAGVPGAAAKRDACRSFVGVAVPGLPEHLRTHPP